MSSLYLVDDHALVRDSLRSLLIYNGHRVLGDTDDVHTALRDIRERQPDVLLLDIQLGAGPQPESQTARSGLELLEMMRRHALATRTIVLTAHAQHRHIARAHRLGAAGYVLKGAPGSELLAAIDRVHRGDQHWEAGLLQQLEALPELETVGATQLSAREREIVVLAVQGHSSAAIGERLFLSAKTIDTYRSRLMKRLGVADLPALVRLAIREGLIGLDGI